MYSGMLDFLYKRRTHALPQLFWHTDIHSHVCPGIDDGSTSPERSVQLVAGMEELGFSRMVVTPHVTDEVFPNTPGLIAEAYMRLTEACRTAGLRMRFNYSAEYRIDELLIHSLRNREVIPLPGDYLLVENSWTQEPMNLLGFLFELRSKYGFKPVLAHPERYVYYQRHRERYQELRAHGIFFQINLLSLAGHYDRACKNTAEWLLDRKMIDFIGSDLHRMSHLESIRSYLTSRDYRRLEALAPQILNDTLVRE